jgi:hypothetical protein
LSGVSYRMIALHWRTAFWDRRDFSLGVYERVHVHARAVPDEVTIRRRPWLHVKPRCVQYTMRPYTSVHDTKRCTAN